MTVLIRGIDPKKELELCLSIRHKVFVDGQNVPVEEERDGLDGDCFHYLLWVDRVPVGTLRIRHLSDCIKIERVAVLDAYQGRGLGRQLMDYVLSDLQQGFSGSVLKLGAQVHAIHFYEKLGFTVASDVYEDAGILHQDMIRSI